MTSSPPETRDQRAERLAPIAAEWVVRLRDENVDTLAAELLDPLPRHDLYGLIGLLGGAADPSVPASTWWGWVRQRDAINTTGHRGEPVDDQDPETDVVERIRYLATVVKLPDWQIADRVGMSETSVARRRQRAEIPPARERAAGKWQQPAARPVAA